MSSDSADSDRNEYRAATYGDRIAEVYDSLFTEADGAAIDLLADLAGSGPVLELGVGTGRLAIPLVERGIVVHGVDASSAMVEKLRAKPGGEAIRVLIGDFGRVLPEGRFSLVFIAFNTFFGLLTREDQLRCFRNVAAHLGDGGRFVIEAFVPDVSRFDRGQRFAVSRVGSDHVWIEASRFDPADQIVDSQMIRIAESGIQLFPVRVRYAWPSELDLMAEAAGLRLRDRWAGWRREPFTSSSPGHVSVYEPTR